MCVYRLLVLLFVCFIQYYHIYTYIHTYMYIYIYIYIYLKFLLLLTLFINSVLSRADLLYTSCVPVTDIPLLKIAL